MTCAELVELVTAFLEGALDPDTERRFIEHLAVCDGCEIVRRPDAPHRRRSRPGGTREPLGRDPRSPARSVPHLPARVSGNVRPLHRH